MFDFIPPSSPEEALDRARKLNAQGKVDRAIKTLEKSLKGTPEDYDLLLELGRLYFKKGGMKEAASRFKQAGSLLPKERDRWIDFVEILHYEGGQPAETGTLLLEVYLDSEDYENGEKILRGLPPNQLDEIVQRYVGKLNAIYSHKSASELSQKDISLHHLLAILYEQRGEEEKMKEILDKVLQASPPEIERILKTYKRMATSQYSNPFPFFALGELYLQRNQIEEAVEAFHRVLELDDKKRSEIIQKIETLHKEETPDLKTLHYLSQLYRAEGEFDRAIDLLHRLRVEGMDLEAVVRGLREILRLQTKNAKARFELGETYLQQERIGHALEEFTHSIELDPENVDEVMERYRGIFEKDPGNPTALIHYVDFSIQREAWDEVISTSNKSFEANPGLADEILPRLQPILVKFQNELFEGPRVKSEFLESRTFKSYIQGLALMGRVYTKKGKTEEAVLVYDHLLTLRSTVGATGSAKGQAGRAGSSLLKEVQKELEKIDHPKAFLLLGTAQVASGEIEKGLAQFAKVRSESPDLIPEIFYELDQMMRIEEGRAEDVLRVYEALSEEVDPFLINFVRGETLSILGKGDLAFEAYQKCLELDPSKRNEVNEALRRLIQRQPKLIPAHLLLGDSYLEMGKVKEATQAYEKVSALDPNSFEKIFKRYRDVLQREPENFSIQKAIVDGFFHKGMYGQVREECELGISLFPKEGFFYLRMGEALSQEGQLKEAIPHLLRTVQLDKNLLQSAGDELKRIVSIDSTLIEGQLALGNLSILLGRFDEACHQFQEIARHSPERRDKAIQGLKKVIEENRTYGKAYYALGEHYLRKGSIEEGLSYFQKGMEVTPTLVDPILQELKDRTDAEIDLLRGKCYLHKGLFPLASENFLQALSKKKELRQEVIHGLFLITQSDHEDLSAQYALSKIYRTEGNLVEASKILSQIAKREEEVEKVMGELREIHALDPSNGKVLYLLGILSLRKGEVEEAVQHYEEVLKVQPQQLDQVIMALRKASKTNHPNAIHSLAKVLMRKGEIQEAVGWIGKLVEMKNGWIEEGIQTLKQLLTQTHSPEGALLLGKLFLEKGDEKEARDTFASGLRTSNTPDLQMDLLLFLSRSLSKLGFEDQAEERFNSALKVGSERKEVYHRLTQIGQWERWVEIRKIEERIKQIHRIPSEQSAESAEDLLFRKVGLYRELGEVDRAMAELNRIGKMNVPDSGEFRTPYLKELALCHLQKGDLLTACELLREIPISNSPISSEEKEILDLQARCYERMGDLTLALAALKRIAREDREYRKISQRIPWLTALLAFEKLESRPRVLSGVSNLSTD
ncbi:tetratricopeptide repeat protein [candidate division TA06 bacterium]|nr:tetratricopeptide repeat protein [candidate division TA06 bacterium]